MQHLQGQVDQNDIDYISQRYGAPVLGLPCPTKNGKINPHVSRFLLANGKMADVFHIKPIYYETIDGKWRPLSEVSSYHGNKRLDLLSGWEDKMSLPYLRWLLQRMELINGKVSIPYPLIGLKHIREGQEIFLTTSTFYPDPDPETTTVDGYAAYDLDPNGDSWATHIAATGNLANDTIADYGGVVIQADNVSDQWSFLTRYIALFDTSAIPDTDTISSATASWIGGSTKADPAGWAPDMNLYTSTPASNTGLVGGDYNQVGSVAKSSAITYANWSTTVYNDFALNDLTIISKTGVTKLGLRNANYDVAAVSPTWSSAAISRQYVYHADQADTTSDPKLVVVHSAPATATGNFFQLF